MFFRHHSKNCLISTIAVLFAFQFFLVIFAPSSFASSTPIDFSTYPNYYYLSLTGFCASNRTWEYGSLKYNGSTAYLDNNITKSFTDNNYNQIQFVADSCGGSPWGISAINIDMRDSFGWETDGKWLNIDVVSNNDAFPIFNGSVVYGYDDGAMVPGFIDKRTYDVMIEKDSYTWLSGRDQVGTEYAMEYDEVNITTDHPAYTHHIQFSIPYHASEYTSNGVSNIQIGTSMWLADGDNDGSHFVEFGGPSSPLFYLNSGGFTGSTMFWIYVSVSDDAEFDSEGSWTDQWSADFQATQDWINEQTNNATNSVNSLNVNFSVPWIVQPWFDLFTNSSCVSIPTISSWLRSNETQVCTPWTSAIRNVTTPIFTVVSSMVLFGFVIRWLRHGSTDETYHEKGKG